MRSNCVFYLYKFRKMLLHACSSPIEDGIVAAHAPSERRLRLYLEREQKRKDSEEAHRHMVEFIVRSRIPTRQLVIYCVCIEFERPA